MNKINLSCRSLALFILIFAFSGSNQLIAMDEKKPVETSKDVSEVSSAVAETETVCPICLLPIDASELVKGQAFFNNCDPRHVFHGRCLAKWIITRGARTKCPMCFRQLYTEMKNNESLVERSKRWEGVKRIAYYTFIICIMCRCICVVVYNVIFANYDDQSKPQSRDWDKG